MFVVNCRFDIIPEIRTFLVAHNFHFRVKPYPDSHVDHPGFSLYRFLPLACIEDKRITHALKSPFPCVLVTDTVIQSQIVELERRLVNVFTGAEMSSPYLTGPSLLRCHQLVNARTVNDQLETALAD